MTLKEINFSVDMYGTTPIIQSNYDVAYTGDESSINLRFAVTDEPELEGATAILHLKFADSSHIERSLELTESVFSYTLKGTENKHAGVVRADIIITKGGAKFTRAGHKFKIDTSLDASVPLIEYAVDTLDTLMDGAEEWLLQTQIDFGIAQSQRADEWVADNDARADEFAESQTDRTNAFDASEAARTTDFNASETGRSNTFTVNENAREAAAESGEAARGESFELSEYERATTFGESEAGRVITFNGSEADRTIAFNTAEAARSEGYTKDHDRAGTDHTRAENDHDIALTDQENYDTLLTNLQETINDANENIAEFDVALQNGIVATNIAAELQNLEETYAPNIVSLTSQLAEKVGGDVKAEPEDLSATTLGLVTGTGGPINLLSIPQDSSVTFGKLGGYLADALETVYSKNIYDKSLAVDNKYYNTGNGVVQTATTYSISGKVPVSPSTQYTASGHTIETIFFFNGDVFLSSTTNKTFVTPSNCTHVGLNIPLPSGHAGSVFTAAYAVLQIEAGAAATGYVAYSKTAKVKTANYSGVDALNKINNQIGTDVVTAFLSGDTLRIRSGFNALNDMVYNCNTKTSTNGGFMMLTNQLISSNLPDADMSSGVDYKPVNDDICPIVLNGTYFGGNHGLEFEYQVYNATVHNKTEVDIGSVWTDANGYDYILLRIPSTTKIAVISEYTGVPTAPIRKTAPVSPLTHKSGATNTGAITFTSAPPYQVTPCINNRTLMVKNDRAVVAQAEQWLSGDYIDVCESYNIIDAPSMLTYLKGNVGLNTNLSYKNDAIAGLCRSSIVYRFSKNGSMSVYSAYDFYKSAYIDYVGFTQSHTVGTIAYVPNTIYDTFTTMSSSNLDLTKNKYRDANVTPYRYLQFAADYTKAMTIGYNLLSANITQADRLTKSDSAGFYSATVHKMYPYWLDKITVGADEHIALQAFRVPFIPYSIDSDIDSVAWYWHGDDIILMIDCHKTINKYMHLPDYFIGKKITQLDVHANMVINQKFVEHDGIKIKNTTYGYAVLQIS